MDAYTLYVLIVAVSAFSAYINHRYIRLPFVIGIFVISSVMTGAALLLSETSNSFAQLVVAEFGTLRTDRIVLQYMLGYLLFAAALHTEWGRIRLNIGPISVLAMPGVIVSTVMIAAVVYYAGQFLGLQLSIFHCLLFGALISPTDPIAVLGILNKSKTPDRVKYVIVGESLFNDGVGVVVYAALLEAQSSGSIDAAHVGWLFAQDAIGGLFAGVVIGLLVHYILRRVDDYETEIIVTLAAVAVGYHLCTELHVSGALAMVVYGMIAGNFRKDQTMSRTTRLYVTKFWELIDVVLNAFLFMLMSTSVLLMNISLHTVLLGCAAIIAVLLSRFALSSSAIVLLRKRYSLKKRDAFTLSWGALRGGVSLALCLALPDDGSRSTLLFITYCVVAFSIVVQGLSINRVVNRLYLHAE